MFLLSSTLMMLRQKNPVSTKDGSTFSVSNPETSTVLPLPGTSSLALQSQEYRSAKTRKSTLGRFRRFIRSLWLCKFYRCLVLVIMSLLLFSIHVSQNLSFQRILQRIVYGDASSSLLLLDREVGATNALEHHKMRLISTKQVDNTREDNEKQLQGSDSITQQKNMINKVMNPFENETISMEIMGALFNEPGSDLVLHSNITLLAIRHLYEGKKLPKNFALEILKRSKKMLKSLSSVVEVDIPIASKNVYSTNTNHDGDGDGDGNDSEGVGKKESSYITVVGDTHGHFYGVMHIFDTYGFPTSRTPYIFNGDMIDSGDFSFSLFMSLLMIKLSCPNCIYFTRGNHESSTKYYGKKLRNELQHYGEDTGARLLFKTFTETINELPIAILANGNECRALVMHGGIIAEDMTVEHIMNVTRGREPEYDSFFENLLWADPQDKPGVGVGGRGTTFGPDVTESFLERNGLCLLIRGHTYLTDGYWMEHNDKLITLYSAPEAGHQGAIVRVDRDLDTEFHKFASSPYPLVNRWSNFVGFDT